MGKATTTIRQTLNHKPELGAWFAANQALFNQVASFYFEVIFAHEHLLALSNQEALTAHEHLTHQTKKTPHPVMEFSRIAGHLVRSGTSLYTPWDLGFQMDVPCS